MKKLTLLLLLTASFVYAKHNKPEGCTKVYYCSQMHSCKEAHEYLKKYGKCALMDGDGDGIPCERQWCKRK
jgi:hypothetical protein